MILTNLIDVYSHGTKANLYHEAAGLLTLALLLDSQSNLMRGKLQADKMCFNVLLVAHSGFGKSILMNRLKAVTEELNIARYEGAGSDVGLLERMISDAGKIESPFLGLYATDEASTLFGKTSHNLGNMILEASTGTGHPKGNYKNSPKDKKGKLKNCSLRCFFGVQPQALRKMIGVDNDGGLWERGFFRRFMVVYDTNVEKFGNPFETFQEGDKLEKWEITEQKIVKDFLDFKKRLVIDFVPTKEFAREHVNAVSVLRGLLDKDNPLHKNIYDNLDNIIHSVAALYSMASFDDLDKLKKVDQIELKADNIKRAKKFLSGVLEGFNYLCDAFIGVGDTLFGTVQNTLKKSKNGVAKKALIQIILNKYNIDPDYFNTLLRQWQECGFIEIKEEVVKWVGT